MQNNSQPFQNNPLKLNQQQDESSIHIFKQEHQKEPKRQQRSDEKQKKFSKNTKEKLETNVKKQPFHFNSSHKIINVQESGGGNISLKQCEQNKFESEGNSYQIHSNYVEMFAKLKLCHQTFCISIQMSEQLCQDARNYKIEEVSKNLEIDFGSVLEDSQYGHPVMVRKFDDEDLRVTPKSKKHANNLSVNPCESINILNSFNFKNNLMKQQYRYSDHLSQESVAIGFIRQKSQHDKTDKFPQHPQLRYSISQTLINDRTSPPLHNSQFLNNPFSDPHEKQSLKFKQSCINPKVKLSSIQEINDTFVEPFQHNLKDHINLLNDSSSSSDNHQIREMKLSEKKIISEQNNLEAPLLDVESIMNFRESTVELGNFYELQEKKNELEQEKDSLISKIFQIEQELKSIKSIKHNQTLDINILSQKYQNKITQIQGNLYLSESRNLQLHSQLQKQRKSLLQLKIEQNQEIIKLQKQNQAKKTMLFQLTSQIQHISQKYQKQIQILRQGNQQQKYNCIQLSKQFANMKENYETEIKQFQNIIVQQNQNNIKLQNFMEQQKQQIQQLRNCNTELFTALQKIYEEKNQFIELKCLIQAENTKIKNQLKDKLQQNQTHINYLETQRSIIGRELTNIQNRLKQKQQQLTKVQKRQNNFYEENCRLKLKIRQVQKQISIQYQVELDYLKSQVVSLNLEVQEKNNKIQHLSNHYNEKCDNSQNRNARSSVKINFVYANLENEEYINQLEILLVKYERIIEQNMNTIHELGGKVEEYLGDALEKQRQGEELGQKLQEEKQKMNSVILDKIMLYKENQQLKKMIAASEKKISGIGNRLISAAQSKIASKHYYYEKAPSSNQTLKMQNY